MIEYSLKTPCKVSSRPGNARLAVGQLLGVGGRDASRKTVCVEDGRKKVENDRAKRWKKKTTYLKCRIILSNEWAVLVEY